jgi:hypothetical protein
MSWLLAAKQQKAKEKAQRKAQMQESLKLCNEKKKKLKVVFLHPVPDYMDCLRTRLKNLKVKEEEEDRSMYTPLHSAF